MTDKLVDQLPAKLWPRLQPYFFSVASAILALQLIGLGTVLWHRVGGLLRSVPH